jgi:hypothetical protein
MERQMMTQQSTEIAYLKSGFVRIIERKDGVFEVQTKRFRGEGKAGNGSTLWKKLYGVRVRDTAIRLLESYG